MFNETWHTVKDGDPRARALFNRHYSRRRYADGRRPRLFVGPGEKMVLLSPRADALFVWRLFIERGRTEPIGLNCAVFRSESALLASDMIAAAEDLALIRWPKTRTFYTYVAPRKVRSANPGYCFKIAGYRLKRITPRGLHHLEKTASAQTGHKHK